MTTMRIGLIGAGSMGRAHAAAIAATPGAELAVVCDRDASRAASVAHEFGAEAVVSDVGALLAGGVDGVVVATPEALHRDPVMACLLAGLHVLVEKPLATSVAEAREILDAAAQAGRVVIAGFNLRYDERHREVKRWLDSGRAGSLASLYLRRNRPAALFDTYQRVHPGFESTSHDIDLALWLTGQRVRSVFARQQQRRGEQNPFGLWSLMELEDGTVVTTESAWTIPPAVTVPKGDVLEAIGESGTAHVDVARETTTFWDDRGVTELRRPLRTTEDSPFVSIDAEIADFVACATENRPSQWASLADAVHAVEVVDALIRSAASGAPIVLEAER